MLAAGLEEKIKLVLDNHDEFDAGLLRLADEAKRLLARETELINRMRAQGLMNRRIVNVLTACRLYLDQSSHTISELFGDKSNEVSAAKQRRRAAYNRNLSYRFVRHCAITSNIEVCWCNASLLDIATREATCGLR